MTDILDLNNKKKKHKEKLNDLGFQGVFFFSTYILKFEIFEISKETQRPRFWMVAGTGRDQNPRTFLVDPSACCVFVKLDIGYQMFSCCKIIYLRCLEFLIF